MLVPVRHMESSSDPMAGGMDENGGDRAWRSLGRRRRDGRSTPGGLWCGASTAKQRPARRSSRRGRGGKRLRFVGPLQFTGVVAVGPTELFDTVVSCLLAGIDGQ